MRGESGQHSSIQPRAGAVSATAFNLSHSTLDWTQGEDEEEEEEQEEEEEERVRFITRCCNAVRADVATFGTTERIKEGK